MVVCLNYYTKACNKSTRYVNQLLLTSFSPFDIKCKKMHLMQKTSGNVFLGHLGEWFFHIFPRLHSVRAGGVPVDTFQNFHGLWYLIQVLCNIWDAALCHKKSVMHRNCCYIELHVKCDRTARSSSEIHRYI